MQPAKAILTTNHNQKVSAENPRITTNFAASAGIDLVALAQEKFQVAPEDLTKAQDHELFTICLKNQPKPVLTHYHYCGECGSKIDCYEKDCTETEGYDHCDDELPSRPQRWGFNNMQVVI
jgi:hypothetical protein